MAENQAQRAVTPVESEGIVVGIEQQWEFCTLALWETRGPSKRGWTYDLLIQYYGPSGGAHVQLSEFDTDFWEYNPWLPAMGQLGAGGWELVSVQHGNGGNQGGLLWDNKVAYFKRPVRPGRAVDEPKLSLRRTETA